MAPTAKPKPDYSELDGNSDGWQPKVYYEVGVFWRCQGYGGTHAYHTLEEAKAQLERIKAGGYPEAHIRKVTIEVCNKWKR